MVTSSSVRRDIPVLSLYYIEYVRSTHVAVVVVYYVVGSMHWVSISTVRTHGGARLFVGSCCSSNNNNVRYAVVVLVVVV